jgi:hypothetical protein
MNLYIETENGQFKNHPAFEDNLIQAFGAVPSHWEPFIRVERPVLNEYQVFEDPECTYEKINGIWTDVFHIRELTADEKEAIRQAAIQTVKDVWANQEQAENWSTWVFNETTVAYDPPIPRPELDQAKLDAGIRTFWCGADANWKDAPVRPEGKYKFDFIAWAWVAL